VEAGLYLLSFRLLLLTCFFVLPQQRNMSGGKKSSRYRTLRDESLRLITHGQVPDVIILQGIVQDETQSITQICWQVNPHSTNDLCSLLGISGRTLSDFFSKCRKAGLLTWVPERGQYVHRCWTLTVMPGKACCPLSSNLFFKKNQTTPRRERFIPKERHIRQSSHNSNLLNHRIHL